MKKLLVLAFGLLAIPAFAADPTPEQKAMMDKMTKAATPGAQHAMLSKMAGEWTATVKFQMDPSQPWQESAGTSVVTSLMDGPYIQESNTSTMMGMPFSGMQKAQPNNSCALTWRPSSMDSLSSCSQIDPLSPREVLLSQVMLRSD